jgi:polyferredoxin
VRLSDGSLRNAYTMHIINKAREMRLFELTIEGLPGADVKLVGDTITSGNPLIVVGHDQVRELRVLVTTHDLLPPAASIPRCQ